MMMHGYEITGKWKNGQQGQTALAEKSGQKYILKQYQTPVAPLDNGTLDAKTFAHNKAQFEAFVANRKKINATIRSITGPGGNIIIPCDEFIDGNHYVEASEFVDRAVKEEELEGVLAGLPMSTKKLLMQTAAGALASVHGKHIIHSDLKLKNVLLVRNEGGNYVAKLIDFDSSYFEDQKPEEIVGTIDYYSPELGAYADAEDEREELGKRVTEKSDIFSLGLIFHFYMSGELPTPTALTEKLRKRQEKGKTIYCWIALNSKCELQLSKKISNPRYAELIRDMLQLDPDDRPSAIEVLKRLQSAESEIEKPWPEHAIAFDRKSLDSEGVVSLRKVSLLVQKKYELLFDNGKKKTLGPEELLSKGYAASLAPVGFCKPWPEHDIVFDIDRIKSRGYVSGEQSVLSGVKGYLFYKEDAKTTFFRPEALVSMRFAKKPEKKPADAAGTFAAPWPEHHIAFDMDVIKQKGFVGS